MAAGVNKVILVGNLTADPELRQTASGTPVCDFRMATNERFKDRDDEWQERAEFHRVVCWGKRGEMVAKYLGKGSPAYIEGKLRTRKWEDRDGNTRYTTEIVANDVQFLSGKQRSEAESAPSSTHVDDLPF